MSHATLEQAKKEMIENGTVVFTGSVENSGIMSCYNDRNERVGHIHSSYTSKYEVIYETRFTAK